MCDVTVGNAKEMGMKYTVVVLGFCCFCAEVRAQEQAAFVEAGNELYKDGKLSEAVASYDKVTDDKYRYTALLNKGTVLYKLRKLEDAERAYNALCGAVGAAPALRADAYYNVGVLYSYQNKLKESIDAYKNALRLNNSDDKARENLQKALSHVQKGGVGSSSQPLPLRENKSEAQQQLDKLEEKEKNTMIRILGKKYRNDGNVEKDW